jgi:hypothetical protein
MDDSKTHGIAPLEIIKHHQYRNGGGGEHPHEAFYDVTQTEKVDIYIGTSGQ